MTTGTPAAVEVEGALEEILAWDPLARSPQLASFLRYVVEKTLAGEEASIKAYTIAVDVFGRPQSFDPQSDPIVRVQARRLRALLEQFYGEGNESRGIRIMLPVGRYVPTFEPVESPQEEKSAPASVPESPPAPASQAPHLDLVFWSRLFVAFAILIAAAVAFLIWSSGNAM